MRKVTAGRKKCKMQKKAYPGLEPGLSGSKPKVINRYTNRPLSYGEID
jgi:hypothetical protein